MMQRTANENAASLRRIRKRSAQPKLERLENNDASLILRRNLNGASTWQSPNWKPRIVTVDSCLDLVGSRQQGVTSNKVIGWSTDHPNKCRWWLTSDETQIQILQIGRCHMKNARQRDNGKNPEYHVVVAIRRLRTDKNCPVEKSWPC